MHPLKAHSARRQSGLSLVELLIGMTIGLFIVGAGITVLVVHLRESRSLIAQSRLMQDLRAASDLIARDLRRVGYWGDAASGVWQHGPSHHASGVAGNPYTAVTTTGTPVSNVAFRYSRDAVENGRVDDNEQFGYRLRNGVLELQLGATQWQAMTDITTMRITGFVITPAEQLVNLEGSCSAPCAAHSTTCPPRLRMRSMTLAVTGRSVTEATADRTVRTHVRLRNDEIIGRCPA